MNSRQFNDLIHRLIPTGKAIRDGTRGQESDGEREVRGFLHRPAQVDSRPGWLPIRNTTRPRPHVRCLRPGDQGMERHRTRAYGESEYIYTYTHLYIYMYRKSMQAGKSFAGADIQQRRINRRVLGGCYLTRLVDLSRLFAFEEVFYSPILFSLFRQYGTRFCFWILLLSSDYAFRLSSNICQTQMRRF